MNVRCHNNRMRNSCVFQGASEITDRDGAPALVPGGIWRHSHLSSHTLAWLALDRVPSVKWVPPSLIPSS